MRLFVSTVSEIKVYIYISHRVCPRMTDNINTEIGSQHGVTTTDKSR